MNVTVAPMQESTQVKQPSQIADFLTLTKPRIGVLALITVAIGAALAFSGQWDFVLLAKVLVGTWFVASGSSALNQLLERDIDSQMERTANRPLPSGRMQPSLVLTFGLVTGIAGTLFLAVAVNWLTGFLAFATYALYVFLYTPLKKRTTLNTAIGAIPGALPPVIGWAAVTGSIGWEAVFLFAIVFLWQFPHFLAIAWMYKDEYAKAKLKMLTVDDPDGKMTAFQMISYCLVLLPVSLMPTMLGWTDKVYFFGALALGLMYLLFAVGFWWAESFMGAKRLLRASIVYLPALLVLLLLDWNTALLNG